MVVLAGQQHPMARLSPVVWSEGMYLAPHHFQAQSRYFEDAIHHAVSSLWSDSFGLTSCSLDREALRNGTLSLRHAAGIFPDGLPFAIPDCDPLPETRKLTDIFPLSAASMQVLLAIPGRRSDGLNCAISDPEAGPSARYWAENCLVEDENTGREQKAVRLARKNLRLVLESEITGDLVTLPLTRIVRGGPAYFLVDERFIPPCLAISASERLMTLLTQLIETLEDKGASITGGRGFNPAVSSTREIAQFWQLHTVHSSLGPLRHLCFSKRGHPKELYLEMARLAGALCTFVLDSHPRSLPPYDHVNPTACFEQLEQHIQRHLNIAIPQSSLSIPLHATGDCYYEGEVADERALGRCEWILGIRSQIDHAELITRAPKLVKFCSAQFVPRLVSKALPGLALTHIPVRPPSVPSLPETQYFSVSRTGPCWEHIVQTRRVGIYVPVEIPKPDLRLFVDIGSGEA